MSLMWQSFIDQLTNLMSVASSTDPEFSRMWPGAVDYAEGRCYRELDLYATRFTDVTGTMSSGARTFTLPTATGSFLVVERLNVLTGSSNVWQAVRHPVTIVSPDFVDTVYPSAMTQTTGLPQFAARISDTTMLLGPTPDHSYAVETYGTQRPTPLSSTNQSTWLTQNVPELFMAASMVFASGFMRDFGAQADNPQMAQSWENQYQTLFKSANTDEMRKKYQSVAWSNAQPSPLASPPRV